MARWNGIAAVAQCANINLKLGGIGMPRLGFDWHGRTNPIGSEELATSMAPLMRRKCGPVDCDSLQPETTQGIEQGGTLERFFIRRVE